MAKNIIRKILIIIPIMLVVSIAAFLFTSMATGDPAQIVLSASGVKVNAESLALKRAELGLDRPIYVQYLDWLNGLIHLNLGTSYISGLPVINDFSYRLGKSLKLTGLSLVFLALMTLPLGVAAAVHKGKFWDKASRVISFISVACPSFCIALVLLYFFGVKWRLISVLETEDGLGIILPALTIAFSHAGSFIRLVFTSMDSALSTDYVKAARAKGLGSVSVIYRHALKNAVLPLITKFGLTAGGFLAGSAVIEVIFSYRGMGTYIMSAITSQDYPVIQAYVVVMAAILCIINLLVDVIYSAIDPRIKAA